MNKFRVYSPLGEEDKAIVEYLKIPYLYREGGLWKNTAELEALSRYEKSGKETLP